eukprot:TRINITY_DN15867_c0_g1_i1.p1 TRINITY_DN15867_c0_g1~~TRINITY_DN15867_c0_g1_i1.p1  ORF type:complete len:525 (+),score=70.11 TRINITY_DN15867_c0_g1_i1:64-1575(+)
MKSQVRRMSRAVRQKTVPDKYYPREWFSQQENVVLGMSKTTSEWADSLEDKKPGSEKHMSPSKSRDIFWKLEKSMSEACKHQESAGMYHMPYLDWPLEQGCKPFLKKEHAHHIYTQIHQHHVDSLVNHTIGSTLEAAPLEALIDATAFDATRALIHHHACMHWNMLFFWKSIVPFGSVDIPVNLRRVIWRDFEDGPKGLEKEFLDAAINCVSNGFVWLIYNPVVQKIEVRTTHGSQSLSVLGVYPLIGCNIHDNCISPGYGLDKAEYLRRFWLCVDWEWAAQCYDIIKENTIELAVDTLQESENDVHLFPVMVTQTLEEEQLQRLQGIRRGSSPIAHITAAWESWKVIRNNEKPLMMTPNTEEATFDEQAAEFYWKNAFNYHFLSAQAYFNQPYPVFLPSWTRSERWFSQMDAKYELRSTACFPPTAGIPIPEEDNSDVIEFEAEESDMPLYDEEEASQPWKEMREKWFHVNVHEKEWDFWKRRSPRHSRDDAFFYGKVQSSS